jgi:hypothetical protein
VAFIDEGGGKRFSVGVNWHINHVAVIIQFQVITIKQARGVQNMTYYPDLSPYSHHEGEANTYNIGWLDGLHDFPTGDVPLLFIDRLEVYLEHLVHMLYLGGQDCEICDEAIYTGEIRVFGASGQIYAAPSMIIHYVCDHHYCPPDEFIQAVLSNPLPSTTAYKEAARNCSWYQFARYWPQDS